MAADPIVLTVTTDADEAQLAMRALASAVQGLTDKVSTLGQKQADTAVKTETLEQTQQRLAAQSIAVATKLQGVASAVQGLVGQLGGQSRTAGLIGASIQTSVQFAQLGMMLGPGGALVGGIVGALIPAIHELTSGEEAATAAAVAHAAAIDGVVSAMARQRAEVQQTADLRAGSFGADTSDAQLTALRDRQAALLAEREAGASGGALGQLALAGFRQQYQERIRAIDDEIRRRQDLTAAAVETEQAVRETAEAQQEELRVVTELQTQADLLTQSAEGAARLEAQRQAAIEAAEAASDAREAARAQRVADRARVQQEIFDQRIQQAEEYAQALTDAADGAIRLADAETEAMQAAADALTEQADGARALFEQQKAADTERLEHEQDIADQVLAKQAEHNERVTEQASSAASSLIASLTDVIGQIAEGNATAEEGAKLMLAAFLQALSQRAQIEALAQVAQAIGSYPDVGGMAAHAAAALAWGAVAVATGVGGAAISSSVNQAQAARQEAQKPASPRSEGVSSGKGGGTTVINFNGPVMTAQGRATFGRMLNELGDEGRQRFPGA